LAAAICCAFAKSKAIRWGAIPAVLFFAVTAGSRGTMLSTCLFVGVCYALYKGTAKAVGHAVLALFLAAAVLMASTALQNTIIEGVFRLHDPTSGLGSGFTGRTESWKSGFELFWESPLIGHGFRAATDVGVGGIHSGYIKIFVESGLIGGLLIVSAVYVELFRRIKLAMQFRGVHPSQVPGINPEETMRLNTMAAATMCTMLAIWVFEPMYINIGASMAVVFFLMLAAPSYVSAPKVGTR
jgi:O-antigen ligase